MIQWSITNAISTKSQQHFTVVTFGMVNCLTTNGLTVCINFRLSVQRIYNSLVCFAAASFSLSVSLRLVPLLFVASSPCRFTHGVSWSVWAVRPVSVFMRLGVALFLLSFSDSAFFQHTPFHSRRRTCTDFVFVRRYSRRTDHCGSARLTELFGALPLCLRKWASGIGILADLPGGKRTQLIGAYRRRR